MRGAAQRERGFALLIVLWTLVLLTLVGTAVTAAGRSEARLALNIRLSAAAEAAADGAIEEAAAHLVDATPRHWPADGSVRTLRRPGAVVELWLDSEAGKVNPNTAQPALLDALLRAVGTDGRTAATLAAAIVGWRYPDVQGPVGDGQYRAAGLDYMPPRARFQSLDEIGLVLGMTPALLDRLRPHLSLFHDGDPDPVRADPAVRQALASLGIAVPEGSVPDDSVVSVTATATVEGGTRFVRHAVIRTGAQPDGALFRILAWDTGQ